MAGGDMASGWGVAGAYLYRNSQGFAAIALFCRAGAKIAK
jgi:hypothetical protein